ncbi:MAG: hypothetical protein ACTSWY_08135 [Promethearchaeota archaeon]
MGIAVAHFDLGANELGVKGNWKFDKPDIQDTKNLLHIILILALLKRLKKM